MVCTKSDADNHKKDKRKGRIRQSDFGVTIALRNTACITLVM